MEKRKRKRADKDKNVEGGGLDPVNEEQEKLRRKVTNLIEKQKLHAARRIVKGLDNSKPWPSNARVQVCFLFHNHW